jgi:hypothetical protein
MSQLNQTELERVVDAVADALGVDTGTCSEVTFERAIKAAQKALKPPVVLRKASEIPRGGFFRKKTGTYVYMRISAAAVRFHKLDENTVYGVCFNGNVADVPADKEVAVCTLAEFQENIDDDEAWHRAIGARDEDEFDDLDK